jgi:hypothetical protein
MLDFGDVKISEKGSGIQKAANARKWESHLERTQ